MDQAVAGYQITESRFDAVPIAPADRSRRAHARGRQPPAGALPAAALRRSHRSGAEGARRRVTVVLVRVCVLPEGDRGNRVRGASRVAEPRRRGVPESHRVRSRRLGHEVRLRAHHPADGGAPQAAPHATQAVDAAAAAAHHRQQAAAPDRLTRAIPPSGVRPRGGRSCRSCWPPARSVTFICGASGRSPRYPDGSTRCPGDRAGCDRRR